MYNHYVSIKTVYLKIHPQNSTDMVSLCSRIKYEEECTEKIKGQSDFPLGVVCFFCLYSVRIQSRDKEKGIKSD
jgi:hypothetical protein